MLHFFIHVAVDGINIIFCLVAESMKPLTLALVYACYEHGPSVVTVRWFNIVWKGGTLWLMIVCWCYLLVLMRVCWGINHLLLKWRWCLLRVMMKSAVVSQFSRCVYNYMTNFNTFIIDDNLFIYLNCNLSFKCCQVLKQIELCSVVLPCITSLH